MSSSIVEVGEEEEVLLYSLREEEKVRLLQCTTCDDDDEVRNEEITQVFETLKQEDAVSFNPSRALICRGPPAPTITLVPCPSPIKRSAAQRMHRRASPTWLDGLYSEMKAADEERTRRKREDDWHLASPGRIIEVLPEEPQQNASKRQRWSVEAVESALKLCNLSDSNANSSCGGSPAATSASATFDAACSTAIVPARRSSRLVRWERKQQVRRQQTALSKRRCRAEVDVSALELSLATLVTSE